MLRKLKFIVILCFLLIGCARIIDIPKVIWGSSTRALEEARADAISRTYRCSFGDCYDTVISFARKKTYKKPVVSETDDFIIATDDSGFFDIFIKNRKKRHIVVMGITGNVDTTEAGIFFSQPTLTTVKLEITSLSSIAKRTLSEKLFEELDLRFSVAE